MLRIFLIVLFIAAASLCSSISSADDGGGSANLERWAVALMVAKAPPARVAKYAMPGHEESEEQVRSRFGEIARAAIAVGKTRPTVATLLAIAFHESGYAHDVDAGPCYRGKDGKSRRCDGGASACVMQIRIGAGTTREGWTRSDLFADREKCFTVGLRLLRSSSRACAGKGIEHSLDAYAGGSCSSALAHKRGLELLSLARLFAGFVET